ncbi:MAG: ATP:cob(I)alamin adenosyltransferase, partial [Candidatus Marinimicrobia bacterium]|nr:ATP:cob(I)alamin adenosyltransferase [Candidatus Neomarinimicrobiota bacterium]
ESETMNKELPPLKEFILPGGSELSSRIHIARTECRDTERTLVALGEVESITDLQRHYLNRLSDYLFILARKVKNDEGSTEVTWDYNE